VDWDPLYTATATATAATTTIITNTTTTTTPCRAAAAGGVRKPGQVERLEPGEARTEGQAVRSCPAATAAAAAAAAADAAADAAACSVRAKPARLETPPPVLQLGRSRSVAGLNAGSFHCAGLNAGSHARHAAVHSNWQPQRLHAHPCVGFDVFHGR
jgi:hypothetical protein